MNLAQQKCVPCEGGTSPMSDIDVAEYLKKLSGWEKRGNVIERKFEFADFALAMKFVNAIADIAEREGHHPDLSISYNKVTITLSTHAIGGLSLNDFILAAKIDEKYVCQSLLSA
ncbi:MAG: 4a-hydroxytetrahydrobiopterin dehydratase [Candidatus Yonathbacteria bacterium CG_4_10_14_3_um_filter_47_65]|uniref:Putative pterin-4-alpha-carbinolamine dehydratase n=2 Tax=Parcubacteria group TaxID=1794811 RepID=A0A2M8D7B6_9BACT|nr:MAG: hypothetical protein AUJ44_04415 [Candidatus Nomurabacteria bacterium CG1_02_47_685]PIP04139.1 MAG: 4a-hydroxytetrahydrobiopterin dehydratase [Candidatus Yonathbacteria bacterium CG23_combo_of_CG06-09_8_20_14_all_46_18]PIQ31023.1 MAG: 4a-hydroxytetrahydrobiopterin dehydratase [Candidatus Yonathbacteria bacterium CG17_big_fil_post_rev_8_21_14_2_50_46_19]PIX56135.1 MAG: 4a-hydroxytetrahydrobiopterin dehydratase [Candidatus Yonathbacteria bacterium CG_4_10_14_3_um_filter_47_65]PIY57299.1 M